MDRDEWPPAMFEEGGAGSGGRGVTSADNRGAGASIGNQCHVYTDGSRVRIVVC
jgi:filamentous hemagglutinin